MPVKLSDLTCKTCVHYNGQADGIGECRKNSPRLITHWDGYHILTATPCEIFPLAKDTSWCGEGEWFLICKDQIKGVKKSLFDDTYTRSQFLGAPEHIRLNLQFGDSCSNPETNEEERRVKLRQLVEETQLVIEKSDLQHENSEILKVSRKMAARLFHRLKWKQKKIL